MCTHLTGYIQGYISPCDEDTNNRHFIQKLESFIAICVERLLNCYSVFVNYQDEGELSAMDSALRTFFAAPLLLAARRYKPQFLTFEHEIAIFALQSPIQVHLYEHIKRLSDKMVRVIEFTTVRLTELYFLCRERFWQEVRQDIALAETLQRLNIYELVSFKDIDRTSFIGQYEVSKHAESLLDSYVVILISKYQGVIN